MGHHVIVQVVDLGENVEDRNVVAVFPGAALVLGNLGGDAGFRESQATGGLLDQLADSNGMLLYCVGHFPFRVGLRVRPNNVTTSIVSCRQLHVNSGEHSYADVGTQ